MQEKIEKFKNIVIQNCSNNDFAYREWMVKYHLEIVEKISMELCDIYKEADRDVVQVLVWFHDFGKPIDENNEREITKKDGTVALINCGFAQDFIDKILYYWNLMEKKNEVDLSTTPIETQIVSSADGASHFVGVFYATYFGDGNSFSITQKELSDKMKKDWERKIVLPEAKESFKNRYNIAREMIGEFPDKFLS